jgi:hypothetical protein
LQFKFCYMKKKHRDIKVNDVDYTWIARENNSVTIWKGKKIFCEGISYGGDGVTPKTIASAIKIVLEHPDLADSVIHDLTELVFVQSDIAHHRIEEKRLQWEESQLLHKLYPTAVK